MTESTEPKIRIAQVFVSSVIFQHREDALTLPAKTDVGHLPFDVSVEIGTSPAGDQGIVKISMETPKEGRPLYYVNVEMIGLVEQEAGAEKNTVRDYLIRSGAFMIFPFMRECIANITARGRFGPVWVKPVNFEALAKRMQENADRGQLVETQKS